VKSVVTVASTLEPGTYPVAVTATAGKETATASYQLVVLPAEAYVVRVASSGNISVKKNVGGSVSGTNKIIIERVRGTALPVTVTQTGFQKGITGRATLGTCTPPCSLPNSVTVGLSAVTGTYPMTINVEGPGVRSSASYNLNVAYSEKFGFHFESDTRKISQRQNFTAPIEVTYPFDVYLDGGTYENVQFTVKVPNASTTASVSPTGCRLPCSGVLSIRFAPGMKPSTYTTTMTGTVERYEGGTDGTPRLVKYTKTLSVPVTIVSSDLPFAPQEDTNAAFDPSVLN
jgi:hypothetical protein